MFRKLLKEVFLFILMNVIIIKGTYKKNGMTSSLVDYFVKGMKKTNNKIEIEVVDLLDKKIEFCTGCQLCVKDKSLQIGKCPFQDDVKDILKKMIEADVIVFATPVYDFGPTALLKRFMERAVCMSYFDPYPKPRVKKRKGKQGVVILSAACPAPFNDLTLMTAYPRFVLKFYLGFIGCTKKHVLSAGGMERKEKFRVKWRNKSYKLGIKVAKRLIRNSKKKLTKV
jgi:multimeric flavodoxin WrbA